MLTSKRGWSALEYLLMTTAIVTGLILGAVKIKDAVNAHMSNIATKISTTSTQ